MWVKIARDPSVTIAPCTIKILSFVRRVVPAFLSKYLYIPPSFTSKASPVSKIIREDSAALYGIYRAYQRLSSRCIAFRGGDITLLFIYSIDVAGVEQGVDTLPRDRLTRTSTGATREGKGYPPTRAALSRARTCTHGEHVSLISPCTKAR